MRSLRRPQNRKRVPFSNGLRSYLSPTIRERPSIPLRKSTKPHATTIRRIPATSSSMEYHLHDRSNQLRRSWVCKQDRSAICFHNSICADRSSWSFEWFLLRGGWCGRSNKLSKRDFVLLRSNLAGKLFGHLLIRFSANYSLPVVILFVRDAVFSEPGSSWLAFRPRVTLLDNCFPVCQTYLMSAFIHA